MSQCAARNWILGSAAAAALLVGGGASAQVVFTVNSVLDQPDDNDFDDICHTAANTCTLRAAVMEANTIGGPGVTIMLPASALPYGLTRPPTGANGADSGDLNLTTPGAGNPVIAITGAGAATTIIDANQIDGVFTVHEVRTAHISGVTLRNGLRSHGGGILNRGVLTVSYSTLSGNVAIEDGGAILNIGGTLTLAQSSLSGNSATSGGGMSNLAGDADVLNSTISGNQGRVRGGGVSNFASIAFDVTNSTISGNRTDGDGGGIHHSAGPANIYNSTIVFNQADSDSDEDGGDGGGIYVDSGAFNLRNSVVAGNNRTGFPDPDDCRGSVGSYARNKFGTVSGCTVTQVGAGNATLLASLGELATLQDNGGPTRTHALVAPSNMINGTAFDGTEFPCVGSTGSPLTTDQRGAPRIAGTRCDIGAFEFGASVTGVVFASSFE